MINCCLITTHYPPSFHSKEQTLFLPSAHFNIEPCKSLSFIVALKPFFSLPCRRKKMLCAFVDVNTSVAMGAGAGAMITACSCHVC